LLETKYSLALFPQELWKSFSLSKIYKYYKEDVEDNFEEDTECKYTEEGYWRYWRSKR
jgi:hypothetical protein